MIFERHFEDNQDENATGGNAEATGIQIEEEIKKDDLSISSGGAGINN
jgi:hypothetical protein